MIKGEYKNLLNEVFDVLGFSADEKAQAMDTFKKKVAFGLLKSIQQELPEGQQEWLADPNLGPTDPRLSEIHKTIQSMYSEDQLYEKSRPVFKEILEDYVSFMEKKVDESISSKLHEIAARI